MHKKNQKKNRSVKFVFVYILLIYKTIEQKIKNA
jgi:hypothetical protein